MFGKDSQVDGIMAIGRFRWWRLSQRGLLFAFDINST